MLAGGLVSLATAAALALLQRRIDRADRIRQYNLKRIEETRRQLVSVIDSLIAGLEKDPEKSRGLLETANAQLLANARLVGDVDALASTARALVAIQVPVAAGTFRRAVPLAFASPWTQEHKDALTEARRAVLSALDLQQERAVRDEPLVIPTPDEIRAVPELADPEAAVGAARAAQVSPGTPEEPTHVDEPES